MELGRGLDRGEGGVGGWVWLGMEGGAFEGV